MYTGFYSVECIFDFFSFETTISTLSSGAYWKLRSETDQGQETNNPHLLAARIIRRGGTITHTDVNSVLAPQGLSVTEAELDELKSIPLTQYKLPIGDDFKQTFPRSTTEPKWGIYMFTNTLTNALYVGSSSVLESRLLHYWKNHSKTQLRPILDDIRTTGLKHFSLSVYVFPVHLQEMRLLLALEQYYILSLTPQNNSLMVVNASPGGKWLSKTNSITNSVRITMYHNDVPIYVFDSMNGLTNNALSILKVKSNDLIAVLNSGELLWGEFTFTRSVPDNIDSFSLLSLTELLALIGETKTTYKKHYVRKPAGRPKSTTPSVNITRLSDMSVFKFDNFNSARTWLLKEAQMNVSNDTIRRRIKSGVPLNGFRYASVSDS